MTLTVLPRVVEDDGTSEKNEQRFGLYRIFELKSVENNLVNVFL